MPKWYSGKNTGKRGEHLEDHKRELRQKVMCLPLMPGVYLTRDKSGTIIYVGKAETPKNQVSQRFGSERDHNDKMRHMVSNAQDFEHTLTGSELEALVLECSLIKQYTPKYNILFKDDKGYHYIHISGEKWPGISEAKQLADDDAEYIGPYTSSWSVKRAVDKALKIFRLLSCSRRLPQDIGKGRPRLSYYIKQHYVPCRGCMKPGEYHEVVPETVGFLHGDSTGSMKRLTKKMEQTAENFEFECAVRICDRITAVQRMRGRQEVVSIHMLEQDAIALAQGPDSACMEAFRFRGGSLMDRETFPLGEVGNSKQAHNELPRRYCSTRDQIPLRLALDGPVKDVTLLEGWLTQKAGRKVNITTPRKGEQVQLVEMCHSNAAEQLAQQTGRTERETSALDKLARLLGLEDPPQYIESYDISNLAGGDNVAGMVVFENGRLLKSAYRRFQIKGFEGQDDYGAMREVTGHRLGEYYRHKGSGEGFGRSSDLILLGGGKGHISMVHPILQQYRPEIPLLGMVEDDKHCTRATAKSGGEISIHSNRSAFTLVPTIQDETHRFATGYYRQMRRKNTISGALTGMPGVGNAWAKVLLRHFRTITTIREVDLEQPCGVRGMTRLAAQMIYEYLHPDSGEKDSG